jgi:excisionase family DNA binding protein
MTEHGPEDWMTPSEIGEYLNVDPQWVRQVQARGGMPSYRHGSWTERKSRRRQVDEYMRYGHAPLWARRGWPEAGFVCFIQAESGGPIKICAGLDPKTRLRDTQRGRSERMVLLATLPGQGRKCELHDQFVRWRIGARGDDRPGWFREDAPGLAELIAAAQQQTD